MCRYYRDSPRHRAAWDAAPGDAAVSPPPSRGPCASLGKPITGAAADRLGLSVLRTWHPCEMGHGEQGHVCACAASETCGGCGDWAAAGD